jgi:hypothetical protein
MSKFGVITKITCASLFLTSSAASVSAQTSPPKIWQIGQPKKASLKLVLKSQPSGMALSAATVSVYGTQGAGGLTDVNGNFAASNLIGPYDIKLTKSGYAPYAASINVTGQESIVWTVGLQDTAVSATPSQAGFELLLKDGVKGTPVPGALVTMNGLQGMGGLTNANGQIKANSFVGKYEIKVNKDGFAPYTTSVRLAGSETIVWTVLLIPQ